MSITCKLGIHSWKGCKCNNCEKIRDEQHVWSKDSETCLQCGKIAPYLESEKKGIKLKEAGDFAGANKAFKEAILLGSSKSLEYIKSFLEAEKTYNKANDLLRSKNFQDAINNYDKALELYPEFADVWANKGIALFQINNKDEAVKCLKRAAELGNSNAKNNLKAMGV